MKLSDLKKIPSAPLEWALPHIRSNLADPPITEAEARNAEHAVCRHHGGLITWQHTPSEDGRVFYCPQGASYWRFSKKRDGMYAPLKYDQEGAI